MRDTHAARHVRLPKWFLWTAGSTGATSIITGSCLWFFAGGADAPSPSWLGPLRILHGCLTPVVAGLIGYILAKHIPAGLKLQTNRGSGGLLLGSLLSLILTAMGLYYSGPESHQTWLWAHRIAGLVLVASIVWHILEAFRWKRDNPA